MSWHLPIMKTYRLSIKQFTVSVSVDGLNRIQETAPITQKFIGQPLDNLEKWMRKIDSTGFEKDLLWERN